MKFRIKFSKHSLFEISRRQISMEIVEKVVMIPQQIIPSRKGRVILQSKFYDKIENKEMLLRIIVKEKENCREVITVYKTSKIEKYWRKEE